MSFKKDHPINNEQVDIMINPTTIEEVLDHLMQFSFDYGAGKIPMSENPPLLVARKALATIEQLVLERVIGGIDYPTLIEKNYTEWTSPIVGDTVNNEEAQKPIYNKGRNDLRVEQRQALTQLLRGDKQ